MPRVQGQFIFLFVLFSLKQYIYQPPFNLTDHAIHKRLMKKSEKIFLVFIGIIVLIFLLIRWNTEKVINKNKTYVVGIVRERDEMENG